MLHPVGGADSADASERTVLTLRILTAVAQASTLYWLTGAAGPPHSWPATDPQVFRPLLLVATYIPFILLLGLGQIRCGPLVSWAALAALVIAGLGYHDAARAQAANSMMQTGSLSGLRIWLALSASLFVAQALVVDSIIERKLVPPYARHFDTAWKQGAQVFLALVFLGVFWMVLFLGASLFSLVKIEFFRHLIARRWFIYPATSLALAISIHATDVQPSLIRGARSLAQTLFSWLLPLLVVILLGFLGSLAMISLDVLWKTHFATSLLLTAAGLLIFLINCCYQDGAPDHAASRIKRLASTMAAVELIPVVGLATWALSLRVGQYGWTVERVMAAAVSVVACCYALGYASAVLRAPIWLKRIEVTNIVTAYVFLAAVLALFSPIADPARLMVASQVARLESGAVRPEKFDFLTLKFDGARWGEAALAELSHIKNGPDAAAINKDAAQALASTSRYLLNQPDGRQATLDELMKRVAVYPAGRVLPRDFYDAQTGPMAGENWPMCFRSNNTKCLARFMSLSSNAKEAILFLDSTGAGSIFEQDANGQWREAAQLMGANFCKGLIFPGLAKGDFKLEAPRWPDVVIGDQRLSISATPYCEPTPLGSAPPKTPPRR